MAKIVLFQNETGPIIDELLKKYKLAETSEQALKKITEDRYLNGGIILNAAKGVVLGELNETTLSLHLRESLAISEQESDSLAKDILERLVAGAEISEQKEYSEPKPAKISPQSGIPEADRMPPMPTSEPMPEEQETEASPQIPPKPIEEETSPKTQEPKLTPNVQMKRGPDAYREPIE